MPIRLSSLFLRTLREDPSDAEVESHRLLVRAGYIRRAAPGIFTWLPLGLRVKANIERIVREEMERAGAQEVFFPALLLAACSIQHSAPPGPVLDDHAAHMRAADLRAPTANVT